MFFPFLAKLIIQVIFGFRNGHEYAGELHFVHQNPETKQLAVLGFFIEAPSDGRFTQNDSITKEWKHLTSVAKMLKRENETETIQLTLSKLFNSEFKQFWRYRGSLTNPPCSEGVEWTVFRDPIQFDDLDLQSFRESLYVKNYRYPEPIFNRKVYQNFPEKIFSKVPDYNCCAKNEATKFDNLSFIFILLYSFSKFL